MQASIRSRAATRPAKVRSDLVVAQADEVEDPAGHGLVAGADRHPLPVGALPRAPGDAVGDARAEPGLQVAGGGVGRRQRTHELRAGSRAG